LKTKQDLFRDGRKCAVVLDMFSLFSNEKRFKILCVLDEGDFCVNEIARMVDGKISNVSQQLKMLTMAGYLDKRREEQSIIYHLKDQRVRKVLRFLFREFGRD
jgi:ArsR family transcriptional regulator